VAPSAVKDVEQRKREWGSSRGTIFERARESVARHSLRWGVAIAGSGG